jgi:hypothetical protein
VSSTTPLIVSLVYAAVGIAIACSLALWRIPQLSLHAAVRGGVIAFLSMTGVRCAMWAQERWVY